MTREPTKTGDGIREASQDEPDLDEPDLGESESVTLERLVAAGRFREAADIALQSSSSPVDARMLEQICNGLWPMPGDPAGDTLLLGVFGRRPGSSPIVVLARRRYRRGDLDGVEVAIRTGLARDPDDVALLTDLASLFRAESRSVESEAAFRRILQLAPRSLEARAAVAAIDAQSGRLDESLATLTDIEKEEPLLVTPSIVGLMLYSAKTTNDALFEEHVKRGRQLETGVSRVALSVRHARPRRLKIGYVSADFRQHSVSCFIEPALRYSDRARFEVHAYHTRPGSDLTTERLRELADVFHDVWALDDDRLAERIVADAIDVLVDLGGHTDHTRIAVFARKPAPVQASYLGYPATTGLSTVDLRITDAIADPPGQSDEIHTERLVRLKRSAWCYESPTSSPEVAKRSGKTITFGSFNALVKMGPEVVELWSTILRRVPGSRLIIKSRSLASSDAMAHYSKAFAASGIGPDRLSLRPWAKDTAAHLAAYSEVDIALDPFPYNGTTTTCEALWMGVPVITFEGTRHAGRVGTSLLTTVGLGELVARNTDEYVEIACELASDEKRRAGLRKTLRGRMQASALCDGPGFVRELEAAYDDAFARHLAPTDGSNELDALVWRARAANERDAFETADFIARRGLAIAPKNLELAMISGRSNEELGEMSSAVEALRHAAEEELVALGGDGELPAPGSLFAEAPPAPHLLPELMTELARLAGRVGDDELRARASKAWIRMSPRSADARVEWATFLRGSGHAEEAAEQLAIALSLSPRHARANLMLGIIEMSWGRADRGIPLLERASELDSVAASAFSNLLYAHQYVGGSRDEGFRRHLTFGVRHAPTRALSLHERGRSSKIRIGYLSADLREHSVARFIEPIVQNHDRSRFEVTLYAAVARPDHVTRRLAESVDRIAFVHDLDDDALAARIVADDIDVLIELGGHTAKSRLRVMARRPARVLVSYLGYPDTTGVASIDYRVTDQVVDPVGIADAFHVERLVRLPGAAWCFRARPDSPPALRREANGSLVFGSFNDFAKVTDEVLDTWAAILARLPGSRLLLKNKVATDGPVGARVRAAMERHGVAPERVVLRDGSADMRVHLETYGEIDIGLDPFPYCGTTTTCEALDMGVPVVTLAGDRHVARVGASLLARVGLDDLVARSVSEYVDIAVRLGGDRARYSALRAELRDRMRGSSLSDAAGFTRGLESAYETMVRAVIERGPSGDVAPTETVPVDEARQRKAVSLVAETNALLRSQQLELAEVVARQAKATDPRSAEALNALGTVLVARKNDAAAEVAYRAALALDPLFYKATTNIGNLLSKRGDKIGAIAMLERSIALEPNAFRAHSSLGAIQRELGRNEEAIASYERSLALEPTTTSVLALSDLFVKEGRFDAAATLLQDALSRAPDDPKLKQAWNQFVTRRAGSDDERRAREVSSALRGARESLRVGRPKEAAGLLRETVLPRAKGRERAEGLDLLWRASLEEGDTEAAWDAFRQALEEGAANRAWARATLLSALDEARLTETLEAATRSRPERAELTSVYATHLVMSGRAARAEKLLRDAPRDQQSDLAIIHGMSLLLLGRQEEAIARMREQPVGSALLLAMHYTDAASRAEIFASHVDWGARQQPARLPSSPLRRRDGRKLRVGYVSGDFAQHSVGRLIAPALGAFDRSKIEVFAYMSNPRTDLLTSHVKQVVTGFREVWTLDDDGLASAIRSDEIDILVDLAGHTAFNRLGCFARKPAPIQISYLGYPDTTGLATMDYRITDSDADPPGAEAFSVETLLRLPRPAWCFSPGPLPPVPARPYEGPVTFGSFNALPKITPEVIRSWARIVSRSNGGRLILKARELGEDGAQDEWRNRFVEAGLDESRLELLPFERNDGDHLRAYGRVDVALDPFPYAGTMTTCEALAMGVPVVSLVGERHVSRVGLSLLSGVGLRELAAFDLDSYEDFAVRLANDHAYRRDVRSRLGQSYSTSPLADTVGFTKALESAYEEAWSRGPRSS